MGQVYPIPTFSRGKDRVQVLVSQGRPRRENLKGDFCRTAVNREALKQELDSVR